MNLKNKIRASLLGLLFCAAAANADYAGNSISGIDGSSNIAIVWRAYTAPDYVNCIKGATGNPPWSSIILSDPHNINTFQDPQLAVARGSPVSTRAVAVWVGQDLKTQNTLVQAAVLSVSGWNSSAVNLSPNDGSESKHSEYKASISDDGHMILITWTSVNLNNESKVHSAFSSDGGASWNFF